MATKTVSMTLLSALCAGGLQACAWEVGLEEGDMESLGQVEQAVSAEPSWQSLDPQDSCNPCDWLSACAGVISCFQPR